jgi:hypothetical protein
MKIMRPMVINDAALTSSNVPETDYAAYSAGTTYALGARVIVVSTNIHRIYESLQAGNIGHTPASSPTWWLDIGSTNRWRMFDQSVTSQTSKADSIAVTLQTTDRVNAVALANISALTARVKMTDVEDGLVYDQTFSLLSTSGITDWYTYLFEPVVRMGDLVVLDMPPYTAPVIDVTLTATGETVLCGAALVGLSMDVGGTQYGASVGIQDYSVKKQDDYGNYTILERAFRRTATFTMFVEKGKVDYLFDLLSKLRATPTVYIGSELYAATIVYGFYKSFNVTIAFARESVCTLELEGLT